MILLNGSTTPSSLGVYKQTIVRSMGVDVPKLLRTSFNTAVVAFKEGADAVYDWVVEVGSRVFACVPLLLPLCLSASLPLCLSTSLPLYLSTSLPFHLFISALLPLTYLPLCLSAPLRSLPLASLPPNHLPLCLRPCLSAFLPLPSLSLSVLAPALALASTSAPVPALTVASGPALVHVSLTRAVDWSELRRSHSNCECLRAFGDSFCCPRHSLRVVAKVDCYRKVLSASICTRVR